ncbi:unnamed protein product [Onchocerca flexuosa]|uniref:Uncharacterized protein n=1 Tax=Onchocerca flexuosa TaxID=387005 RepID=A0A183HM52_9BILA|nr:unnamed protein product [Onchocerca flexuosa]
MAEPTSAPSPRVGATVSHFSISHLLQQSSSSSSTSTSLAEESGIIEPKNHSQIDGEYVGISSSSSSSSSATSSSFGKRIPEKAFEAAGSNSSQLTLATTNSNRLLAALQTTDTTTCLQPHLSPLSLNPAINLLKQSTDSFMDQKSDNNDGTTVGSHFNDKSILACHETTTATATATTTIPLWLNCAAAATAAVLPFEQSFLMAQRSG